MKDVVVLGGAGELGSNFAKVCIDKGLSVKVIDIVREREAWRHKWLGITEDVEYVWKSTFDLERNDLKGSSLILDAACQPDRPLGTSSPIYTQLINLTGPTRILEVLSKMETPPTTIYPSSSNIFIGVPPEQQPLVETTIPRPINYYAWSKLAAEQMYQTYSNIHKKMNNIIIRTGSCFGPGMRSDQMVANCILHMLNGEVFNVRSPGASRTYTYTGDVLRFYDKMIDMIDVDPDFLKVYNNVIHNGGNNEDVAYTTIDIARKIRDLVIEKCNVTSSGLRPDDYECGETHHDGTPVMQYEKSIVAEKALGWKPQFTVEQGLRETIDWFDTYHI
jgi:nucleoside-diphosphate-sugar epimerase